MQSTARRAMSVRGCILMGLGALLILLTGLFLLEQSITGRRREEAIRSLKKPDSMLRHQALAARAKHGSPPQTLEEVAGDLGNTVPLDPFTGEPFHYLADANKFLLYGVGRNMRDDSGTPNWRDGDIVWRGDR